MQLAIISDIHGNEAAFEAVICEIHKLGIDQIICLGDVVNPFQSSDYILSYLLTNEIPMIRGNHEDYIIDAHRNPHSRINLDPHFKPVQLVAKSLNQNSIPILEKLPLCLKFDNLLFCHGSPDSNNQGWKNGYLTPTTLKNYCESICISAHWHDPQDFHWDEKTLISVGSVGIPQSGKREAEFLLMESKGAAWEWAHKTINYDYEKTISDYVRSGWFHQGGPIAWLLLCEIILAQGRVKDFFHWAQNKSISITSLQTLSSAVINYLQHKKDWDLIEPFLS